MNLNLSPEENYRHHRALPPEQIATLLDSAIALEAMEDFASSLYEAKDCLPEPGFLKDEIEQLKEFSMRMQGNNLSDFLLLIDCIESDIADQYENAKHGAEQLAKVIRRLP